MAIKKPIPDAFERKFPVIREADQAFTHMKDIRPTNYYKMGKIWISYSPEHDGLPAILSVSHPKRLPEWDEMVWIRYKLGQADIDYGLILPPLGEYINYWGGRGRFTLTMEALKYRHLAKFGEDDGTTATQ